MLKHESDLKYFDSEFTECEIHSFEESPGARNNLEGFSYDPNRNS